MSQNPAPLPASNDPERLKIAVDVWKYVVSVQMHFNDMEMKVRNLYFTILAAAIGAVGVAQGKWAEVPYLGLNLSMAMLAVYAILPISALFYFIDRHWYHRLLQASVKQAGEIEARYKVELPEIQLGSKISTASPFMLSHPASKWLFFFVTEENFRKYSRLHSDAKIEILYKSVMVGAGILATLDAAVKGVQFDHHPPLFWFFHALEGATHFVILLGHSAG